MILQRIRDLQLFQQKKIRWFLLIFLLIFAALILKILLPNPVYHYEGSSLFEEGVAEEKTVYDNISLPAGVYEVELEFAADTDLSALCTMRDGTVFYGGLLTNGEHLYAGNERTGYCMWLFEGTDHMQAVISYNGKGQLATGDLTIRQTDKLWTMLLTLVVFAAAVVMAAWIYRQYDRKYGVEAAKKQVFFFVTLIAALASVPCMYKAVLGGADLTYHLQRIEGCKDGILSGQFPVRLEPEWVYGHGYANAVFYCNALLYFPALLRLSGFTVTTSYNLFCVAMNLVTAWIAWYCFKKIFKDDSIGLICSALYTLSLYRIYKLYACGAVGEGCAYAFLPLVLYGMYRAFTEDPEKEEYRSVWLSIALGYAGLLQTHVLTCEITAFVTLAVCLVCIRKIFRKRTFLQLCGGVLGAVGLSAWYLVPFLDYYITQDVHIKHVSGRTIQERGLQPAELLIGLKSADYGEMGIGPVLTIGLCIFLALFACRFWKNRDKAVISLGLVSAVSAVALMVMSLEIFPWDAIQRMNALSAALVSSLQFPNRFLGWGTAFLVAVYGFVLWCLRDKKERMYQAGIAVAVVGIAVTAGYRTDGVMGDQTLLRLYNEEGMGFGYISGAEYLIQGTDEGLLTFEHAKPGEGVELKSYQKNYLKVDLGCRNQGGGEGYIDLPLLFYKGYRAYDTDTGKALKVSDGFNHLVRVTLPEGFSGNVRVQFASPFYWRIAEIVSMVTVVYLLWLLSGKKKPVRQNERKV